MVTAQEVVGSTPAEFTKSTSKTKQTPENKDFQEFFFFPDLPKIQQNEAVKTGEIGGLYFSPILVHRIDYYSLFLNVLQNVFTTKIITFNPLKFSRMERNYFSILFFIKRTKLLKNGEAPICLRITVNGKRAEVQIKRSVEVNKWNSQKECATGRDNKTLELNHYLETVRTKILRIHRQLEQDNKPITAEILKYHYYGESEPPKMLLEVFKEHNQKCSELIGKDYVRATVMYYERTTRYLSEFIKQNHRLSDIPLKDIDYNFIQEFEHFRLVIVILPTTQTAGEVNIGIIYENGPTSERKRLKLLQNSFPHDGTGQDCSILACFRKEKDKIAAILQNTGRKIIRLLQSVYPRFGMNEDCSNLIARTPAGRWHCPFIPCSSHSVSATNHSSPSRLHIPPA